MTETLDALAVEDALATIWLGHPVHYYEEVGSTNEAMQEMARLGAPSGTLLLADFQSQGKGRLNRRWDAPPGTSLLCSLLFRPDWPAERAAWLIMSAGVALATAVWQVTGLQARLKWPNDLMIPTEGGWSKSGGLLVEGSFADERLVQAILGTGVNVNMRAGDLPHADIPATSLQLASGEPVSRLRLLITYLAELERAYEAADAGHSPQEAWNELLITIGQEVSVRSTDSPVLTGRAEGTDNWGRLLVRDRLGRVHAISAGDATLSS